MLHRTAWLLTSLSVLSLASGCGSSWPTVNGVGDPSFVRRQRAVHSIDILPVDLAVTAHPRSRVDAEAIARGLEPMLDSAIIDQLASRGYDITAAIDWNGSYDGGAQSAMTEDEVALTTMALSSYGIAQASSRGHNLLIPHLPVLLGSRTGSDATLYIGGWAHQGIIKHKSTASKVATGVLIGALVVGVVALAILGAKEGGGSIGKVGGGVAKAVTKAGAGALRVTGGVGRAARILAEATTRGVMRAGVIITREGPRIAVESLDAWGRAGFHTHVHVNPIPPDRPPPAQRKKPMRKSAMLLEMTLVDNRTGLALWHVRRQLPASPRNPRHVQRAVRRMLASLPPSL